VAARGSDQPVEVARFTYRHVAEMALGILQDEGIPGVVVGDDGGGMYPGILQSVRLVVPEAHAERARRVLEEMERDRRTDGGEAEAGD
jgi:hypothetical protein